MKLTWLGQAGYQICTADGTRIMIDPYLSNHLELVKGVSFHREIPVAPQVFDQVPDVLVLTHIHEDHTDPETLERLLGNEKKVTVLAPLNVWRMVRDTFGGNHNYVMFDCGIEITASGVLLRATYAAHSDERPIGVVIQADGQTVWHTGDTLYHRRLLTEMDGKVDALILPVNGQGNNMNAADAARLTRRIEPRIVLPMHWDMFREYGCDVMEFVKEMEGNTETEILIPEVYREFLI